MQFVARSGSMRVSAMAGKTKEAAARGGKAAAVTRRKVRDARDAAIREWLREGGHSYRDLTCRAVAQRFRCEKSTAAVALKRVRAALQAEREAEPGYAEREAERKAEREAAREAIRRSLGAGNSKHWRDEVCRAWLESGPEKTTGAAFNAYLREHHRHVCSVSTAAATLRRVKAEPQGREG